MAQDSFARAVATASLDNTSTLDTRLTSVEESVAAGLKRVIVQQLPTEHISTTTIYMVPKSTVKPQQGYDEFMYINNAWEKIGDTEVDLTDYAQKTWVEGKGYITAAALDGYATESYVDTEVAGHHDTTKLDKGTTADYSEHIYTFDRNGQKTDKTISENIEVAATDDQIPTALAVKTALNSKQSAITAGANIQINNNVISATDTTYTAGTNITIDENNVISATGGGGSAAGAVRYDEAQSLTEQQLNQAWSNLTLGCAKTTAKTVYGNWTGSVTDRRPIMNTTINKDAIVSGNSYTLSYTEDGIDYSFTSVISTIYSTFALIRPVTVPSGSKIEQVLIFSNKFDMQTTTSTSITVTSMKLEDATVITTYTPISNNLLPNSLSKIYRGTGDKSLIFNSNTNTSTGAYSNAFGENVNIDSTYSLASGKNVYVSGEGGEGGVAFGIADVDSGIWNEGECSLVFGKSESNYQGSLKTRARGSLTFGVTQGNGLIQAGANVGQECGCYASGYTINGVIKSTGNYSHAEGYSDMNSGNVIASGDASFAMGTGVQATGNNQFVIGKCNQTLSDKLFIIGNGTTNSSRSNALTVDWNGNLVCNNIPSPPAEDGDYHLKCSIVSGVATYTWVAE